MTLDLDLDRLLAYESWANREALRSLMEVGDRVPAQGVRVLAHIIGASHLWLARLADSKPTVNVWPTFGVDEMPQQLESLELSWRGWREGVTPAALAQVVPYVNTKGEAWESTVRDILTHLVLHSSYHRGQIAILIGREGGRAAYTDLHPRCAREPDLMTFWIEAEVAAMVQRRRQVALCPVRFMLDACCN